MTGGLAQKRLSKVAMEFNVATTTIIEFLETKKIVIEQNPNAKISPEIYNLLKEKFQSDKIVKEYAQLEESKESKKKSEPKFSGTQKSDDSSEMLVKSNIASKEKSAEEEEEKDQVIQKEVKQEQGLKVLGKIELEKTGAESEKEKPVTLPEEIIEEKEETTKKEAKESVPLSEISEEAPKESPKEKIPEKDEKEEVKESVELHIDTVKTDSDAEEKKTEEITEQNQEEKGEDKKTDSEQPEEKEVIEEQEEKQMEEGKGLTILGKIDVSEFERSSKKGKPVASTSDPSSIQKKRRKRVYSKKDRKNTRKEKLSEEELLKQKEEQRKRDKDKEEQEQKRIKDQVSATLAKLTSKQNEVALSRSRMRKKKRKDKETAFTDQEVQQNKLEVIEFITVNELANLMDASVTDVITVCMNLGLMVSINQRLDAETITVVADEFGFDVTFTEESINEPVIEEEDNEERMCPRAPVVTIMGHVDHGKTSLLDFIRKSHVSEGEAGGITQHIGAYAVELSDGKKITFLDTPGHEAFTSMRARGAKITDIVIIVIATDDSVMPQTKEAISHAQAAGVPIVFALNKIDRPQANPEKIKEQLSEMNILVEDWGGKYQSQEISAKQGLNISELLEKVLLEAEMMELQVDPEKRALGVVIEASLDRGKGIVVNVLVQKGTLRVGDPILAGAYYGRVKTMIDEKGKRKKEAGPSTPVEITGFDGAPTAGDILYVTQNEHQAKELAQARKRLLREQGIRATKHITLDEIGRRIAIGNFKELNLILKGDVDGSVEALSDSMQKLSSEKVQINIIHKAVGQISESDVLLASASDAVIVGFQVRPSLMARKLAEKEQIDIRTYTVIYDAIEEIKLAIEGMLEPEMKERVTCNIEVRDVFKITKVGTIAGCMVLDGKINRNTKVRILREGIVVYEGEIASLKRFKDDVKEVAAGYECGIGIANFNDIKTGDIIEGYVIERVKAKV
jgi:translation initiation factor IF-2